MSDQTERRPSFGSDRQFRLWEFRVSHSQLLVRSPRSPEVAESENIDLIFLGVHYLCLPDHMAGLQVAVGTAAALSHAAERLARPVSRSSKLYEVVSEGKRHVVIAAQLAVALTTCDIMESSLALHFTPDEAADRLFRERYLASYTLIDGP